MELPRVFTRRYRVLRCVQGGGGGQSASQSWLPIGVYHGRCFSEMERAELNLVRLVPRVLVFPKENHIPIPILIPNVDHFHPNSCNTPRHSPRTSPSPWRP